MMMMMEPSVKLVKPVTLTEQQLAECKASNVKVDHSTIPGAGLGVFTTRARSKNENIVLYTGQFIQSDTPLSGPYMFAVTSTQYIDGVHPDIGIGRFVNCCRPINKAKLGLKGNNARFVINQRSKQVWIRATRALKENEEVFVSYGCSYRCFPE